MGIFLGGPENNARGRGTIRRSKWIGPLHLTTCAQAFESPRIDGCCSTVKEVDSLTGDTVRTSYAKGYALRYGRSEALVVGIRSKYPGCPLSPRTWFRMKRYHVLWVLKGRPPVEPQTSGFDSTSA